MDILVDNILHMAVRVFLHLLRLALPRALPFFLVRVRRVTLTRAIVDITVLTDIISVTAAIRR